MIRDTYIPQIQQVMINDKYAEHSTMILVGINADCRDDKEKFLLEAKRKMAKYRPEYNIFRLESEYMAKIENPIEYWQDRSNFVDFQRGLDFAGMLGMHQNFFEVSYRDQESMDRMFLEVARKCLFGRCNQDIYGARRYTRVLLLTNKLSSISFINYFNTLIIILFCTNLV